MRLLILLTAAALSACASTPLHRPAGGASFANIPYASWSNSEPAYQLYVGDEIDMVVPGAPENNKTLTVGLDGRITLPIVGDMMAAGRNLTDVRAEAAMRYASQLRQPQVEMVVRAKPIKVFVGGEVGTPGAYDLIGDSDALRAVIQAGGFKTSAAPNRVIIVRRGQDGVAMMREANLSQAFRSGAAPDLVPLARDDVIYVPRSGVANVGLAMQQYLRDALPFTFNYAINGTTN